MTTSKKVKFKINFTKGRLLNDQTFMNEEDGEILDIFLKICKNNTDTICKNNENEEHKKIIKFMKDIYNDRFNVKLETMQSELKPIIRCELYEKIYTLSSHPDVIDINTSKLDVKIFTMDTHTTKTYHKLKTAIKNKNNEKMINVNKKLVIVEKQNKILDSIIKNYILCSINPIFSDMLANFYNEMTNFFKMNTELINKMKLFYPINSISLPLSFELNYFAFNKNLPTYYMIIYNPDYNDNTIIDMLITEPQSSDFKCTDGIQHNIFKFETSYRYFNYIIGWYKKPFLLYYAFGHEFMHGFFPEPKYKFNMITIFTRLFDNLLDEYPDNKHYFKNKPNLYIEFIADLFSLICFDKYLNTIKDEKLKTKLHIIKESLRWVCELDEHTQTLKNELEFGHPHHKLRINMILISKNIFEIIKEAMKKNIV